MKAKLANFETTLSKIRETFKRVKENPNIANLCLGDPDGDPPKEVSESWTQAIDNKKTHYANDSGEPVLREIIAVYESRLRNCYFHPYDNVVVSNGGTNGIYSFSRAVLDPGDEVLLLDPVWIAFIQITRLLRCKPVMVPTRHNENFVPRIEDLEKALTKKTKVLVVVSPSNPSGAVYDQKTMSEILNFCEKHGLWLLHDEAYRDIIYSDKKQGSFVGHHPNVVGVRTLSKSHNLTGARVGWVLSSNKELISAVRKNIAYNVMCVNTLGQIAATTAIEKCENWLHNNVTTYYDRMVNAKRKLDALGFETHWPEGAFYLFPKHYYNRPIAEEILQQTNVAVIDGQHFGNCGKNHIRISCSVSEEVLNRGLLGLEKWVKANPLSTVFPVGVDLS